ncbi:MAG TPA: hypothetical protein VGF23_11970 [Gaiellaceae bacterium]
MRAPEISVVCECGERRSLPYGARWECETCGRRWNTAQIPAEDYEKVERAVRRYRLEAAAFAAVILAIFAPLVVLVDVRLGITGLIVFFAWAFLFRPWQRRRLVAAARESARWQLRPE